MVLKERTSIYKDETVRYSDIDAVPLEKHQKNACSGALH